VVALLEQLVAQHGAPQALRCDNGPELIAQVLTEWCEDHGIVLRHIQPGKPDQNAFIKRFNRTYREEVLDAWLFTSLAQVREVSATWLETYNTQRPHDSLGRVPPLTFLPRPRARPSLATHCLLDGGAYGAPKPPTPSRVIHEPQLIPPPSEAPRVGGNCPTDS
jgi:transposase InsO family protein